MLLLESAQPPQLRLEEGLPAGTLRSRASVWSSEPGASCCESYSGWCIRRYSRSSARMAAVAIVGSKTLPAVARLFHSGLPRFAGAATTCCGFAAAAPTGSTAEKEGPCGGARLIIGRGGATPM